MNEDKFILTAARLQLDAEHIRILKAIAAAGPDWDNLAASAKQHGVDTFIYYSLSRHHIGDLLPEAVYKRFQESYFANAMRNNIFIDEIKNIAEIPFDIVLLKGADLLLTLYPTIAIRQMGDIDILVPGPEHIPQCWDALQAIGFIQPMNPAGFQAVLDFQYKGHLPALRKGPVSLEVHWYLLEKEYIGKNFHQITRQLQGLPGRPDAKILVFTDELKLIHICLHFCLHLRSAAYLRWMCDINEIILKHRDSLNWKQIEQICEALDLTPFVNAALTYAAILLKTPVPHDFLLQELIDDADSVTLDSLFQGHVASLQKILRDFKPKYNPLIQQELNYAPERKTTTQNQFAIFRGLRPLQKLRFFFRCIFPIKEYMDFHYGKHKGRRFGFAHLHYWAYQTSRFLFKKKGGRGPNQQEAADALHSFFDTK